MYLSKTKEEEKKRRFHGKTIDSIGLHSRLPHTIFSFVPFIASCVHAFSAEHSVSMKNSFPPLMIQFPGAEQQLYHCHCIFIQLNSILSACIHNKQFCAKRINDACALRRRKCPYLSSVSSNRSMGKLCPCHQMSTSDCSCCNNGTIFVWFVCMCNAHIHFFSISNATALSTQTNARCLTTVNLLLILDESIIIVYPHYKYHDVIIANIFRSCRPLQCVHCMLAWNSLLEKSSLHGMR